MSEAAAVRVAVLDDGEGGRRVLRALRERSRAGRPAIAIAVHAPGARRGRFAREADAAVERSPSWADTLRAAGAEVAWLGGASLADRAALAAACEAAGVRFVGPPASALRALAATDAVARLGERLGFPTATGARPGDRIVEVVAARDATGAVHALGTGEASLRLDGAPVLAEAPAPALAGDAGAVARDLAVRALEAAGWTGVAAVRLAYDPARDELALLAVDAEAESRAAVEAVTGVDLAALALRIADGEPLERAALAHGHAVSARLVARDPEAGAPRTGGAVEYLRLPSGLGIRADGAVDEGDAVAAGAPLATFVARAEDRDGAVARLDQALAEADVLLRGAATSRAWLRALVARPEVRSGAAAAGFVESLGAPLVARQPEVALVAAAIAAYDEELDLERDRFLAEAKRGRPQVGPTSGRVVELRHAGERHRIEVRQTGPGAYRVAAGGAAVDVEVQRPGRFERRLAWGGRRARVLGAPEGPRNVVEVDGVPHEVVREPAGLVASPLPAVVVAIPVTVGEEVQAGDPVARVESMKVELEVKAPEAGVVREIVALPNTQIHAGAPLLRIEPLGAAAPAAKPLALGAPAPSPAGPRERALGRLDELRRILLGFDVTTAEAKRLAAQWKEAQEAPADDPHVLRAEDAALRFFADVQSLFSRQRAPETPDAPPPIEELWRYLHEPQARGEGLSAAFVAALARALAHEGVGLDASGRALEFALLRLQKAYVRSDDAIAPLVAILERRLAGDGPPPGLEAPDARAVLDRLVEVGTERFPALADLAREVRYRRFEQPLFERARADAYAQVEADLARLPAAEGATREEIVERLVECTHPLATLLLSRAADAPAALRPRLVEALLRRYYRDRNLSAATAIDAAGVPAAWTEYDRDGVRIRAIATSAPAAEAPRAAAAAARLASECPPDRDLVVELYLWDASGAATPEPEALRAALAGAGFARPVRRAAVVVARGGRGLHREASQRLHTFRGGPAAEAWAEDARYRGVHPMLFERLQLARLAKFDLERQPSVEDVWLYRATARGNPKDERLFAAVEVRDLTIVRGADGQVRLPHLERLFHEALAGMRRFQARRAPGQRLEWNRVMIAIAPPLRLTRDEVRALAERLTPAAEGLGLEMIVVHVRVPDRESGALRETLLRVMLGDGGALALRWDAPGDRPLEPMAEYQQRVVQLRRRGLTHPYEIVRMLAPARGMDGGGVPHGEFLEHDLDANGALVPVTRPPGTNTANMIVGVVRSFTERYPEGVTRVVLLGDPSRAMGSLAEPECRRIAGAIDLAERMKVPLEWFAVSAGAKISMESGTENMDWISHVLRRIIEFTQGGGEINVVVTGINVGAQPYWNAEATMLMHTRGILVMTPGSSMVLTGKDALEFSGSVSAEDNLGIGGYDRIMGPNGQAQYQAPSLADAIRILLRHYDHTYVAPGERHPRRARTADPRDRDVRPFPHGKVGAADFATVGDVFSAEHNPERKKPFDIRRIMAAVADQDHATMERWRDLRGGDTAVVWDAHLGGWPVCLLGIESRPIPRLEFVPADGPGVWSAGTLFPQSSKKIARALNGASGVRPVVVLANLSGFDGSPESMRRLQLEYGAEIGRAVVNFRGPIVFCVVSRYHGGAFVVFSKTLRSDMEVVAVAGARASVIGGAPAAAVVFAREVETRAKKDPRVQEAEKATDAGARARLNELLARVRSEKVGELAEEFDAIHSVERALRVGSIDRILPPEELRPYLVGAVERGLAKLADRE
jgi:acetyl/propionyl-CoA carboxylase alpha subunit/acetyl-CoA carboxylase carboxyltransferase component